MLPAIGIGALIGGLTAKQRGGNFLKGALTGAALGGAAGMLGSKAAGHGWLGAGKGGAGIFGLGKGWAGIGLPLAGITAGTEMLGQQEANLQQKLAQQGWLDEEEDRRIARLNKYAGYDVTDPKNFLTPQKFFMAGGGPVDGSWTDVPMEEGGPTMDPEIMRLPMGQEGSFEEENEGIVGLELAGLTDEEMAELQALQSLSIVTPEDHPQYERIQLRLQELQGRMEVAKGGHINRPGYLAGGPITGEDTGASGIIKQSLTDITGDASEWYDNFLNATQAFRGGSEPDEEGYIMMPGPDGEMIKVKPAFRGIGGQEMAQGGIADLDMRGGGHSIGPGTGTSDDVPAMLSDGEFVMTANAVRNLGGGNRMLGAQRMYNMMNSLDPNSQTPGEMNVAGYG